MEKELQMLEGEHTPNGLKATHKKISNWKTPGLDGIQRSWFKKFTSIHDGLATEMNKCTQKTEIAETERMLKEG